MSTPARSNSYSSFPNIADKELHIWRASLRCGPEALRWYEGLLAPEEIKRAARFLIQPAKEDFIAARGILRKLLSGYLKQDAQIQFSYGAHGKPAVATGTAEPSIQFNISHSNGFGVFAFTNGKPVGVDIEKIRGDFAGEQIADLYFAEEEASELRRLPEERRAEAFFALWTCKEAYLKARGEGLQIPLRNVQVCIRNDGPQELIDERGSMASLYTIEAAEGFRGAVAAEGRGWRLRYFDWKNEMVSAEGEAALRGEGQGELLAAAKEIRNRV